jgi:hypothetical protein
MTSNNIWDLILQTKQQVRQAVIIKKQETYNTQTKQVVDAIG